MFEFRISYIEAMRMVRKLSHSIAKPGTRPNLEGFFIHKHADGNHYAISTDGHRLTRICLHGEYEGDQGDFPAVIFPPIALKQLESLKVSHKLHKLPIIKIKIDTVSFTYRFEALDNVIGSRLVNETYPDYDKVFPKDWQAFKNEYENYGFNAKYLSDIAKAASWDSVSLKYKNRTHPIRIHFQGANPAVITEPDKDVTYLIMPMIH